MRQTQLQLFFIQRTTITNQLFVQEGNIVLKFGNVFNNYMV